MKPEDARSERSGGPAPDDTAAHPARVGDLWELIFSRENLARALRRVEQNAGAAGIDGMATGELRPWSKASGGMRPLGIPTVLDRLIQQAVMQVLQADWDGTFSEMSFGFRPGRSAHHAVERARQFIDDDAAWVVDVDLDAFFDRV